MDFYSHAKDSTDGRIGTKLLSVHLKNVENIYNQGFIRIDSFEEKIELLKSLPRYHDLGKYSKYFQDYLFQRLPVNYNLKSHSKFGALYYLSKYFETDKFLSLIGYWIISSHHSNLKSFMDLRVEFTPAIYENEIKYLSERQNSFIHYANKVNTELEIEDIEKFHLKLKSFKEYFKAIQSFQKTQDIRNYFLTNFYFSLLIEADKLDASDTPVYKRKRIPSNKVDLDKGIPSEIWDDTKKDFSHLTQNQLRNLVRKIVVDKLQTKNIFEQKLFTLTGPTGIGKTLTALDFALKLRGKIKLEKQYEPQIIYALPFINIIEQSDSVYRDLFQGSDVKILSHYQYADALSQQEQETESREGNDYHKKLMLLDTWQCDIVITSFVQFLQTLIGNRNKLLKKFNHYAGSIIILDEVQTLALKQLPLIGASLFYLAKFLDARIVLMTATKPKIFELANEKILNNEGDFAKPMELLGSDENVSKIFKSFKRTKIVPLIKERITEPEEFIENHFLQNWKMDKSCLIVVNTVKLSIEIFGAVKDYFDNNGIENPVYYLSTNILPAHRQQLIDNIKKDIQKAKKGVKLKPLLISTQCVEAGVDLDFDMAFRDLAPIDSIIQVAGRVNRENNKNFRGSIFIVDFGKCSAIYGPMTESTVVNTFENFETKGKEILEENYLDLISYYYENIIEKNKDGFSFSTNFFDSMKKLDYDGSEHSVSKFQVIENGFKTASVFIEIDEKAKTAKEVFENMLNKKCSREVFEKYKKTFHQHIVAVPDYLNQIVELKNTERNKLTDDILIVNNDEVANYYNSTTGFIRSVQPDDPVYML